MWIKVNRNTHWVRGCSFPEPEFIGNDRYCKFAKCTIKKPNSLSPLYVGIGDTFTELTMDLKPVRVLEINSEEDLEMLARIYTTKFAIEDLE